MKRPLAVAALLLATASIAIPSHADNPPPATRPASALPPGFDPARHMRVSEVKDGMKGYGLSVFKGTTIERFDVEVISVVRNFNPKYDVVLVDLKGDFLAHTGGIAGMSGSPIFLKDDQGRERMIGAFAYGWPLMKDARGGVQPIEYMLAIEPRQAAASTTGAAQPTTPAAPGAKHEMRWSLGEALALPGTPDARKPSPNPLAGWNSTKAGAKLGDDLGEVARLRPLATPLMISGMPRKSFDLFTPLLEANGMVPVQAGGASRASDLRGQPVPKLEPGSTLAVPLLTGDMDLTAIGTCTEVLGDRVLGFGHPFFGEGDVQLPMGTGYIHTIVANLANSFKLGALSEEKGTLLADTTVGIGGRTGPSAPTVPIDFTCTYADGSVNQSYHFNAAIHPRFTSLLATMAANTALTGQHELPQYHTVDYDLTLEFANGQKLHLENRASDTSGMEWFQAIGAPINAAAMNPFEKVAISKVSGTFKVTGESRDAEILNVSVPRVKFRPGDTLKAFVTYRPFRGPEAILPVDFELPRDLPEGSYDFAVTDWTQHLQDEQTARPFRFTAENAKEVIDVLRDYTSVRHDAIYLRLNRQPDGVAIGRTAMPRLPSSRRRVMLGAGLSNTTQFVSSTVKSVPTQYVMTGAAHFTLTIDNDAKIDSPAKPPAHPPVPTPTPPKADDKPKAPGKAEAAGDQPKN